MQIVFKGPQKDIWIRDTGQVLERGKPTEVHDEAAERLLRQSRKFTKAPSKAPAKDEPQAAEGRDAKPEA